jgi:hypothetical protein
MTSERNSRIASVAVGSMVVVGLGSVGAYAAEKIDSGDIKNDSIRSKDITDETIRMRDLHPSVANKFTGLQQQVDALQARVDELEPWQTSGWTGSGGSEVVNPDTVRLVLEEGNSAGTSVENGDVGIPVEAGDEISFRIDLIDGATCNGGAPRMFVEVGGEFFNSFDDQTGCAGDTAPSSNDNGTVTFTVTKSGTIGDAGFVYDNNTPGIVEFSDVMVDGKRVALQ